MNTETYSQYAKEIRKLWRNNALTRQQIETLTEAGFHFNPAQDRRVTCIETGFTYANASVAARATGTYPSCIANALSKENPFDAMTNGVHWIRTNDWEEKSPRERKRLQGTAAGIAKAQITVCLETGERFNTAREACKKYGISPMSISRARNHLNRTAHGRHWLDLIRYERITRKYLQKRQAISLIGKHKTLLNQL